MDKLIVFLVRRKLGVKKCEYFRFTNQKSTDVYFFVGNRLYKHLGGNMFNYRESSVSLNWLINPNCKIEKVEIQA